MNLRDWEKRKNELEKYKDTFDDTVLAAESNYAVLGGVNYPIIVEAIIRVFDELGERYLEFINSEGFLNSKEEQEAYKRDPTKTLIVFSTYILIELLKEDGYLRGKLGETEENKLYDDFYIYDYNGNLFPNMWSVLSLCLNHVHIKHANTDKYKDIPLLPKETNLTVNVAVKRDSSCVWWLGKVAINDGRHIGCEAFKKLSQDVHKEYIKKTADNLIFEIQIINFGQTAQKEILPIINTKQEKGASYIEFKVGEEYIWKVFLERDKTGRYPTYDKKKIIEKLWNNQNILIPSIEMRGNDIVLVKNKLYNFAKVFNKPEYYFSINTSPIAFQYKNFIYIDLNELKEIERYRDEYWGKIFQSENENSKKISRISKKIGLSSNQICKAAPIKFNMLLKHRYHPKSNYKNEKTGYIGNCCHISDKQLNNCLGDPKAELLRLLEGNNYIRNHKDTETFNLSLRHTLESIFYCAEKLKWIVSTPKLDEKKQLWNFNLNASYFDKNVKLANLKTLMGK
jgi:hypothetical protein